MLLLSASRAPAFEIVVTFKCLPGVGVMCPYDWPPRFGIERNREAVYLHSESFISALTDRTPNLPAGYLLAVGKKRRVSTARAGVESAWEEVQL